MSLVAINWKPAKNDLRNFGLAALVMLPVVALLLYWKFDLHRIGIIILCAGGAAIFAISRISQPATKLVYLLLICVSFPIGWILSHIIMAIFYYGLLTPIGLVFKVIRRDALHRKIDPNCTTYWIKHRAPESKKSYFNQF